MMKIDTQAPDALRDWPEWMDLGKQRCGWSNIAAEPGNMMRYFRADLSAAREAAAWIAGRDAAVAYHQEIFDHDSQGIEYSSLVGIPISNLKDLERSCRSAELDIQAIFAITPPSDPATALDRLIAERVREAVEAEREACAKVAERGLLPCNVGGELICEPYTGHTIAANIRARGSKEGQDG